MPFYEYSCKACGAHHEAMQKMSDPPLKKCPACGRLRLVRLISAPVFRLKGGGWYETDFKSDKEGRRNLHGEDKSDSAAPVADAKADAKSDAKPDAKSDAKADTKVEAKADGKPATAAAKTEPSATAKGSRASGQRRAPVRRPKAAPKGSRR
jgi:putative FmdB family regulatory protein